MEASRSRKNPLEWILSLFTEVRPGEGLSAILLCLDVFLILTAYYIIKPVREALILAGGGAEIKSYMAAGQAVLLLGAVPLYALLASRFPRRRLINVVTFFFVGCLGAFYLLAQMQVSLFWLGIAFFLWVGIFNLMVVAQFWSFANDLYTPETGKRLFVIVAFGASAGAVFGSFVAGRLIEPVGIYQLLLVAGALLLVSLILTNVVDSRSKRMSISPEATPTVEAERPMPKGGAFRLVLKSRYLLLIALLMLFLNWVNTTGEYILGRTVTDAAAKALAAGTTDGLSMGEYIGKFYADFFTIVNLVGLLMQILVVSRILKYLGVRVALLVLPVIALGGYFIIAFYPILAAVRWAKTAENATDYSLQNTVRQVLFLPTSREEKYKAKQAIDTFFWRAGDVLSAVLVAVGTTWLAFQTKHFAIFNIALIFVWIVLALLIGRQYRRLTAGQAKGGKDPA